MNEPGLSPLSPVSLCSSRPLSLGHNVIKTGLRKISLSYSRISLADIASKLTLDDAASAEFVCAKAIRDGVIEVRQGTRSSRRPAWGELTERLNTDLSGIWLLTGHH